MSQPDRRRGRGSGLGPSPVKAAALELGLPVTDDVEDVARADVPLGVVVAFGRIIKVPVLEAVPMVNLHFSLLPRWRGAAPVERAILAGDDVTGVDLMAVEEGLDTGGIYRRVQVPIGPDETLGELRDRLVAEGTRLLVDALGERSRRAGPAGRRADLRREAPRRGSSARLVGPCDRRPPPGAPGRRMDHAPGQAAQGLAHPRAPHGRRPPGDGGRRRRSSSSRCSPRGRRGCRREPGRTGPVGEPTTASARDLVARASWPSMPWTASIATAPTPTCSSPTCSIAAASRPATATSSPSSSTAPPACGGPATSSSIASSPVSSTSGSGTPCAWAPTSCTSWACRRTRRWGRRWRWRPSPRAAWSTRCCAGCPALRSRGPTTPPASATPTGSSSTWWPISGRRTRSAPSR